MYSVEINSGLSENCKFPFVHIDFWTDNVAKHNSKYKWFFGFPKYSSATAMLLQLRLLSFDTVLLNAKASFCARLKTVNNGLLDALGLH